MRDGKKTDKRVCKKLKQNNKCLYTMYIVALGSKPIKSRNRVRNLNKKKVCIYIVAFLRYDNDIWYIMKL